MKRFALWAVLMLCAGTAFGQTVGTWGQKNQQPSNATSPSVPTVKVMVVGGINGTDTTFVPVTFTGTNVNVAEAYPVSSYQLIKPSVLSTQFLHIPGATVSGTAVVDSCAPVNVQGFTRLALLIYPTCDDSTWAALVALSWRLHASATADSQSTYLEQPWNRFRGVSTVAADSMVARPDSIGTLMPRERNLVNSSGGPGVAANDSLAMLTENVLVINDCATNHRGRVVFLTNKDGQSVSGNWISFSWRHLNTYSNFAGANVALFPYGPLEEPRLRLRADLVGWR